MPKPWGSNLNLTELSLLVSMVYYVHSVILICQHFGLSYGSTLLASFTSVPSCFFIISNCLQMDKSFATLYWNHFLFVSGLLSSVCDNNNGGDLALGKITFLMGIVILPFYTVYIWFYKKQASDSSGKNGVIIESSVSLMANGIALMGRWFIPEDNLLWLVIGTATLFTIGAVFFCYYLSSSSRKSSTRQQSHLLQVPDTSAN